MKKYTVLLVLPLLFFTACQLPQTNPETTEKKDTMSEEMDTMDHGEDTTMNENMSDPTTERLNNSPRHHEWVEVQNGDKTVYTWVVYPEVSENTPVVILIHENRGLNDWARSMADQVAEAGYIAVAPDLLSGFSETETRTSDFSDEDAARNALGELNMDDVMSDLQSVATWAQTIPAADGRLVSAGFCWGGARSFQFASVSDDLEASLVFYGTGPEEQEAYEAISSPVYGFYGGDDARVNATIEQSEQYMTAAGKTYEYEIYDGAGHAFMRSGEAPDADPANVTARNAAFERMKEILSTL